MAMPQASSLSHHCEGDRPPHNRVSSRRGKQLGQMVHGSHTDKRHLSAPGRGSAEWQRPEVCPVPLEIPPFSRGVSQRPERPVSPRPSPWSSCSAAQRSCCGP